jgi:hypothetical protein
MELSEEKRWLVIHRVRCGWRCYGIPSVGAGLPASQEPGRRADCLDFMWVFVRSWGWRPGLRGIIDWSIIPEKTEEHGEEEENQVLVRSREVSQSEEITYTAVESFHIVACLKCVWFHHLLLHFVCLFVFSLLKDCVCSCNLCLMNCSGAIAIVNFVYCYGCNW